MYGLFVDTQSAAYGIKRIYGRKARLDYLQIPSIIATLLNLDPKFIWGKQVAFVAAHIRDNPTSFVNILSSFGYSVHVSQVSEHPDAMYSRIIREAEVLQYLVILSSNTCLLPLVQRLLPKRITFVAPPDFSATPGVEVLHIQEHWLWSR